MSFCVKNLFSTFLNFLKQRIKVDLQAHPSALIRIEPSGKSYSVSRSLAQSTARSTRPPAPEEATCQPSRAFNRRCISSCLGRIHSPISACLCTLAALATLARDMSNLACLFARKKHLTRILTNERPRYDLSCNKLLSRETLFLRRANHANSCAAIRALPLRNGLSVFRNALNRVNHDFLRLALNAISFFCCHRRQPFWSGARERKQYWNGDDSP